MVMKVDVKEIVEKYQIMKYPNVVGYSSKLQKKIKEGKVTDVDCIRIYVTKKIPKTMLRKDEVIPEKIEGIPTDIIEIGKLRKVQGFKERYRPSPCGVSTSRADEMASGTIGWFMVDEDANIYLMSNNHVWAKENQGIRGDQILQPGRLDGGDPERDVIAELYDFIEIDFTGVNKVDVALASLIDPSIVYASIMVVGGAVGKASPIVNTKAKKVGRSTGYTEGIIFDDSATVNVEYDTATVTFTDVFIVKSDKVIVQGGDSGSPVLDENNKFLGLLFAGNDEGTLYVACKASNIESAFQYKLGKKIWTLTINSPRPFEREYVYLTQYQQMHPLTDLSVATILSFSFLVVPLLSINKMMEAIEER